MCWSLFYLSFDTIKDADFKAIYDASLLHFCCDKVKNTCFYENPPAANK